MERVVDALIKEQAFESKDDPSEMDAAAVVNEQCARASETQDDVSGKEAFVVLPVPHRVSA
jgi:phage/plasmid-associated DNA primase